LEASGGSTRAARSTSTITQLLKSATPEELQSDELGERLEQLIKAGQDRKAKHWFDQPSNATGLKRAPGNSTGKVDLSDLDVEKISGQLQSSKTKRRI